MRPYPDHRSPRAHSLPAVSCFWFPGLHAPAQQCTTGSFRQQGHCLQKCRGHLHVSRGVSSRSTHSAWSDPQTSCRVTLAEPVAALFVLDSLSLIFVVLVQGVCWGAPEVQGSSDVRWQSFRPQGNAEIQGGGGILREQYRGNTQGGTRVFPMEEHKTLFGNV